MANNIEYVERLRGDVRGFIAAFNKIKADRAEWDALDLGNVIQQGDIPSGSGITTADLAAAIGTTVDALNALLAAGHATNLYRVT